jgi:hypothetical protein
MDIGTVLIGSGILVWIVLLLTPRKTCVRDASQPVDNRERMAVWAWKWYQTNDSWPNNFRWKWKEKANGSGR